MGSFLFIQIRGSGLARCFCCHAEGVAQSDCEAE